MALDLVSNFAKVIVNTGYDAAATSIVLVAGSVAKFPAGPFNLVWWDSTSYPDPADDPNHEIVRLLILPGGGDTITVVRAQEGTAATTKNTAGHVYKMALSLTAKVLNTDIVALHNGGVPQSVAASNTLLIPDSYSSVVVGPYTVDGILQVDGSLAIL